MKKESLQITTVKTFLAVLLFTGIGTIIIGGGYIIGEYSKNVTSDQIIKPVNQEGNYYDVLEKRCNNDSCCLASLKAMRENNYKEAGEDGKCPDSFNRNMMRCITSYQWCEPMKEIELGDCKEDSDCKVSFSHCDCQYHCVNKNIEADDCAVGCDKTGPMISECVCENNKCVKDQFNTSDWQTYRNEKCKSEGCKYEIKYPNNWKEKNSGTLYSPEMYEMLDYPRPKTIPALYSPEMYEMLDGAIGGLFSLSISTTESSNDIDSFLKKYERCSSDIKDFTINNKKAVKYTDICIYKKPEVIIMVVNDKLLVGRSYSVLDESEIINQILSSFKFIEN